MTLVGTGELLRDVLWEPFQHDEAASRYLATREQIELRDPGLAGRHGESSLSLWLYNIVPAPSARNTPPPRTLGPREAPLVLHYLVTPLAADPEGDLLLLERVLQVFHSRPLLRMPDGHELRIEIGTLQHGELARIWQSLRQPYRLCVSYEVRGARIDAA
jgi:hypothetical protein